MSDMELIWSMWGHHSWLRIYRDGRHIKSYVRRSEGLCVEALERDINTGRIR